MSFIGLGVNLNGNQRPTLGPDLVTNGSFANWTGDDPDDWTVFVTGGETGATRVTEGVGGARIQSDGTYLQMLTDAPILELGNSYSVTVVVVSYTGPNALRVDDSGGANANTITSTGTFTYTFTPAGANRSLRLARNAPGATLDATVSCVSVKKIL